MILRRVTCSHVFKNFIRFKSSENFTKTKAVFLNETEGAPLMLNAFSKAGFRLNNGMRIIGSVIIFPRTVLSWNVHSADQIYEDSLSLFLILEPKIDLIIIGVGNKGCKVNENTVLYMKNKGFSLEILPTEQACSTFNFLAMEGRLVAGALIPPTDYHLSETLYGDEFLKKI